MKQGDHNLATRAETESFACFELFCPKTVHVRVDQRRRLPLFLGTFKQYCWRLFGVFQAAWATGTLGLGKWHGDGCSAPTPDD